jgi:hypothetical protein
MSIVDQKPWNAGSTRILTVKFYDPRGNLITPTSAKYKIEDILTDAVIVNETSITGLGQENELEITGAQNALVNPEIGTERHRLILTWVYGAPSRDGSEQYIFTIQRLK